MHSSRMRTAHSLHYMGEGAILLDRDPPGQRPPRRDPWTEMPRQRPPGQKPPWIETPRQRPPLDGDPLDRDRDPPVDRQTPVKT